MHCTNNRFCNGLGGTARGGKGWGGSLGSFAPIKFIYLFVLYILFCMFFPTLTMYVVKYGIPVTLCFFFIISCWLFCLSSMLKKGSVISTPKKSVLLLTLSASSQYKYLKHLHTGCNLAHEVCSEQ